jgi:RNase P subunit RPR2
MARGANSRPELIAAAGRGAQGDPDKEAMEKKALTVTQGKTRIEAICGKCGAPNRVNAPMGERRVPFTCSECGHKQRTL